MYILSRNKKIAKKGPTLLVTTVTFLFFFTGVCGCASTDTDSGVLTFLSSPVTFYAVDDGYSGNASLQKQIKADLEALAARYEAIFSTEEPDSEISIYNAASAGTTLCVSEDFYTVTKFFSDIYADTDGAVNPQVKLLVDLWGFSERYSEAAYIPTEDFDRERLADGAFPLPGALYIQAFLYLSDFSALSFSYEDGIYRVAKPSLSYDIGGKTYVSMLDYSAAVKGYFADEAVKIIESYGIEKYYISVGGSSLYLSENLTGEWNLRVVNPFDPSEDLLSVPVGNKYVSTSGTYRNYYTLDGKTYSHIINPLTGSPTESDLVSVTLIGDSGIFTDGLSTALINMGSDGALSYLEDKDLDYILITADEQVISSMDDKITYLTDLSMV